MKNIKYNILEQIITEGRLEDMIKKYEGSVSEDMVRQLSAGDPSGNNKYLDWMCTQRVDYTSEYIIKMVECFHENVNRLSEKNVNVIYSDETVINTKIKKAPKDINSYPTPDDIEVMCKYFEEQKPKNASRVKIYEDDKWLVVSPLTHDASCSYGAHSNWCVSTSNSDYYKRYTKEGILVFFLDKKGTNPKKPNANIYKIAVNIHYDRPDPIDWDWYTMEDNRVDAALMMNLIPKNLIEVTSKYLNEFIGELHKKNELNMEELNKNSLITYVENNKIFLFLKLKNWDRSSIEEDSQFLTKFDSSVADDIIGYKDQGLPYIKLAVRAGRLPDIETNYVNWNAATSERRADNTIPLSRVIVRLSERYGPVNSEIRSLLPKLSQEELQVFIDSYVKMFNEAKISRTENVGTTNLQVGDTIIYTGTRRYGSGEQVKVTRVAEKSIQLSNGKRIARTYSNYKKRVTGVMKIVDDRIESAQQPTTESRWIRKRII
jgi:hypothetical protein